MIISNIIYLNRSKRELPNHIYITRPVLQQIKYCIHILLRYRLYMAHYIFSTEITKPRPAYSLFPKIITTKLQDWARISAIIVQLGTLITDQLISDINN